MRKSALRSTSLGFAAIGLATWSVACTLPTFSRRQNTNLERWTSLQLASHPCFLRPSLPRVLRTFLHLHSSFSFPFLSLVSRLSSFLFIYYHIIPLVPRTSVLLFWVVRRKKKNSFIIELVRGVTVHTLGSSLQTHANTNEGGD